MRRHWVFGFIYPVGEAILHDVGVVSPVLSCCARYKNMKKLELLYVMHYLYLLLVAVVPQITHSYGFSKIDGCSIPAYKQSANSTLWLRIAVIERFSLLEGPALCILLASSSAMIVMVIKLCHNFCRGRIDV